MADTEVASCTHPCDPSPRTERRGCGRRCPTSWRRGGPSGATVRRHWAPARRSPWPLRVTKQAGQGSRQQGGVAGDALRSSPTHPCSRRSRSHTRPVPRAGVKHGLRQTGRPGRVPLPGLPGAPPPSPPPPPLRRLPPQPVGPWPSPCRCCGQRRIVRVGRVAGGHYPARPCHGWHALSLGRGGGRPVHGVAMETPPVVDDGTWHGALGTGRAGRGCRHMVRSPAVSHTPSLSRHLGRKLGGGQCPEGEGLRGAGAVGRDVDADAGGGGGRGGRARVGGVGRRKGLDVLRRHAGDGHVAGADPEGRVRAVAVAGHHLRVHGRAEVRGPADREGVGAEASGRHAAHEAVLRRQGLPRGAHADELTGQDARGEEQGGVELPAGGADRRRGRRPRYTRPCGCQGTSRAQQIKA